MDLQSNEAQYTPEEESDDDSISSSDSISPEQELYDLNTVPIQDEYLAAKLNIHDRIRRYLHDGPLFELQSGQSFVRPVSSFAYIAH
jgi:isocitrate lyase